MDDTYTVNVVHSQQHLICCVGRGLLGEALELLHTGEEFAAGHALHDESQLVLGLVDIDEPRYMWMIHGQEYLALSLELIPLVFGHSDELETLHGVRAATSLSARFIHLPVVAGAQNVLLDDNVVILQFPGLPVVAATDGELTGPAFRTLDHVIQTRLLPWRIPHWQSAACPDLAMDKRANCRLARLCWPRALKHSRGSSRI
mmetsp:Transcript_54911/g.128917  ORF Transcript_54911/g.128917 Transcript_54911/m.128917 type:complete len:202 (+) Transcript_54911:1199-1804(+)